MTSMSWSPETMQNIFERSMTTSPKVTGIMPMCASLLMASSSWTTSLPSSATKHEPGGTDAAGIPASISSDVTSSPSSMASLWTKAAGATCP